MHQSFIMSRVPSQPDVPSNEGSLFLRSAGGAPQVSPAREPWVRVPIKIPSAGGGSADFWRTRPTKIPAPEARNTLAQGVSPGYKTTTIASAVGAQHAAPHVPKVLVPGLLRLIWSAVACRRFCIRAPPQIEIQRPPR